MFTSPLRILTMALISFFVPLLVVLIQGGGSAHDDSRATPLVKRHSQALVTSAKKLH